LAQGVLDPDSGQRIRSGRFAPDVAIDRRTSALYVVWQDARFRGNDEVAFTMSTDGGRTWSPPIRVNQTPPNANPLNQQAFIASGLLGVAAFAGGLGSALLDLTLHVVFSLVIAAVFMLAATRLPVLRRNLTLGGLLYGVVVYFVMNFVVTPLSAAPPPEGINLAVIVEGIIGSALLIGLPLAVIARRNANGAM
jgi:uncharacterized membrane protein YagU involved in acid resistance